MNPFTIQIISNDCFQIMLDGKEFGGLLNRYDMQCLADEINITLMSIQQEELVEGAPTVFECGEETAS